MKLRIKYLDGATKMTRIAKGNWIDCYAYEDKFIPVGERAMINLGFALELPKGWEGHLAPRSSTFKTWGVIQTNGVGVVDDTYIGNGDIWHMPVYCLQGKDYEYEDDSLIEHLDGNYRDWIQKELSNEHLIYENYKTGVNKINRKGTWIRKGDKIAQFRIMEVMPEIEFEEVERLGNEDRGSFGSTGSK